MSKIQDILTQAMETAGSVVESAMDWAQVKKPGPVRKTGLKDDEGHDFGELGWRERYIENLLSFAERQRILPLIPDLSSKTCLHLSPGRSDYVIDLRRKRHAQEIFAVNVERIWSKRGAEEQLHLDNLHYLRAGIDALPVQDNLFDFVLYPSALAWRTDFAELVPELVRVLKTKGRAVFSLVHPFFEYLMYPRGGFRKNISGFYNLMIQNNFYVDKVMEGTLSDAIRHVALPKKFEHQLSKFQDLPLVVVFRAVLIRKGKA